MNRRAFLSLSGAAAASAAGCTLTSYPAGAQPLTAPPETTGFLATTDLGQTALPMWEAWKEAYLRADGRVVDNLQRNASHSEGQGYGAVIATEFGDQAAFTRIVEWTERTLSVRGDGLLAWRYLQGENNPIPDMNNATDGDLFYAWALVRASRRFGERHYLTRAVQTARALASQCLVPNPAVPGEMLLLPAAFGFHSAERTVFNPSYMMPLAMREIAAATGVVELGIAALHAEALLLRLAERGPVIDWVQATAQGMQPAPDFSTLVGYEAMRVPLWMIWSGLTRHPAVTQMASVYSRTVMPGVPVPTRIESESGTVVESSNDSGYRALAGLVTCAVGNVEVGADMPPFDPSQPYYPATLHMLSMIAANQVTPQCVPI